MSEVSNELDNDEIDRLLHNYKRFKGCYMKDELPQLEDDCYYIVNLQASTDGSGTHWCCLYVYGKIGIWFDPMGHGAPAEVEERFEKIIYGDRDLQDYNATTCGYFCMGFVIFTYNSKNIFKAFKNYNNLFSKDLMKNDVILKKLLGRVGDGIIL
jgi:hypothetical protein